VNIVQIVGYIVIAIGAFLWAGNVFQFFPTIPLVGWATIAVGGLIVKKSKG
jgi:hypothetical protein